MRFHAIFSRFFFFAIFWNNFIKETFIQKIRLGVEGGTKKAAPFGKRQLENKLKPTDPVLQV
ncbi:MAG: hypothetical protein B6D45_02055 [Ignavibacteriales bacterium UTCHB3]|nr:MAG: hypothetical protein B6D45_02055 [Ignavibacteriales bacterium UTCHB3]